MKKLDADWWKRLFDRTYLVTDARSVCDEEVTAREVDFLVASLELKRTEAILDLCGGHGRHSLELSRRGFKDVTVLDYSGCLLELGRQNVGKEGLHTVFVRSDAREAGLSSGRFNTIIVMASSFGYFVEEDENLKFLQEALRLLKPGGALLLDLPNMEYVVRNFAPQSWHEADEDTLVCRNRSLDDDMIFAREVVVSKKRGMIRDESYCIRLYSPEKITSLLTSAGFRPVRIQTNFASHSKRADYGCMTNRMIVIAKKPRDDEGMTGLST